jgi:hypothetical protein
MGTVSDVVAMVLGAPGSGKTSVVPGLQLAMPEFIVFDWDVFMAPVGDLVGRDVRASPELWPSYQALIRTFVDATRPLPLVILGPCTPSELRDWPISRWLLLDCSDDVRRERLEGRMTGQELDAALIDARRYRMLDLEVLDTSALAPDQVVDQLARAIGRSKVS